MSESVYNTLYQLLRESGFTHEEARDGAIRSLRGESISFGTWKAHVAPMNVRVARGPKPEPPAPRITQHDTDMLAACGMAWGE